VADSEPQLLIDIIHIGLSYTGWYKKKTTVLTSNCITEGPTRKWGPRIFLSIKYN